MPEFGQLQEVSRMCNREKTAQVLTGWMYFQDSIEKLCVESGPDLGHRQAGHGHKDVLDGVHGGWLPLPSSCKSQS